MGIQIPIWPGSGSNPSGSTSFALYDNDAQFQTDAPKVASWCCRRLGYPILDVEVQDKNIYDCFEESVTEYSSQVNQFNIRQNILRLQGSPTGSNLTQKSFAPSMNGLIALSDKYGQEVLMGGDVELRKAHITTVPGQQNYDLWSAVSASFASQSLPVPERSNIEIKRVWHSTPPAIARYFDPFAGTGMGSYSMLQEFGWTNYSPATSFMMLPIYADILRIQAIEFNDTVRRSSYGFEIQNNKITILPLPQYSINIYFDFVLKSDKDPLANPSALSNGISDYSNAPYDDMVYSQINDTGKQWIRQYTLSLVKITLGYIRNKYASIPIPDGEMSLNGNDLITQGQQEKEALIAQIRETLEETTRTKQLEKEAEQAENLQKVLQKIPLKIYVG